MSNPAGLLGRRTSQVAWPTASFPPIGLTINYAEIIHPSRPRGCLDGGNPSNPICELRYAATRRIMSITGAIDGKTITRTLSRHPPLTNPVYNRPLCVSKRSNRPKVSAMPAQPPKLLDQVRMALRDRHYAAHTEEAYVTWITRFILFHHKRHPTELAAPEVLTFLASLTNAAERNAARSAILFLYRQAPNFPLDLPADAPLPPSSQQGRAEERAALLDQAREALRVKHYAYSTEQSYLDWIKRFIRYHNQRHPRELGGAEVAAFLTHLAVDRPRRRLHAESGAQRAALPLSHGAPPGARLSHR